MTRIADAAAQNMLLQNFLSTQRSMFDTQMQITTGKVSPDFKGLSDRVDVLMSSKAALSKSERYESITRELQSKLDLQNLHLETFAQAGKELRVSLTEALANDSGITVDNVLDSFVSMAVAAMNTTFDGRYIFGGTRVDTPPVNIQTVADLVAAPTVADVFDNNQIKPSVRIDEAQLVEYGFLAEDVATDLFTSIRTIEALGPFAEQLTAAQEAGIQAELQNVIAAVEAANAMVAENGVLMRDAETVLDRHVVQRDYMRAVIGDIEDADQAEAITRLNQDQVTSQASARVLADVTQLSLLNFI